jgi:hypothetical protein
MKGLNGDEVTIKDWIGELELIPNFPKPAPTGRKQCWDPERIQDTLARYKFPLSRDISPFKLETSTVQALQELANGYTEDRDTIGVHIFTDGTGGNNEKQLAFAMAIIKTDQQQCQTFGGLFCHRPNGVEDPWLAAADCNGVPQNETAAIIAALAWAIQSEIPAGTIIEIVPDANTPLGTPKRNTAQNATKPKSKCCTL